MPEPFERFLHTYKNELAQNSSKWGVGISGFSITAWLAAIAVEGAGAAAAGTAATVALGGLTGGLALIALPFGYGIAKATFLKKDRQSAVEQDKSLTDLDFEYHMDWDCYWTTVAVVGYERTGKTLLKKRLRGFEVRLGDKEHSTTNLEIHLTRLNPRRKVYMALLDDRGAQENKSADQTDLILKAIGTARIIILVLDHADTYRYGDNAQLDDARLKKHEDFIRDTLIHNIRRQQSSSSSDGPKLRSIMVVMNKADSWEQTRHKSRIHKWASGQAEILKKELSCDTPVYYLSVQDSNHSGYLSFINDLTQIVEQING